MLYCFFAEPLAEFDERNFVSIPIRRCKHEGTHYTVLACAYLTYPLKIFYRIRVSHQKDNEYRRVSDRDFRILKRIMIKKPINTAQHVKIKNKLHRMVVEKKLEMYKREKTRNGVEPFKTVSNGGRRKQDIFEFDITESARSDVTHKMICSGIESQSKLNRGKKYKMADQIEGWCLKFFRTLDKDGRFPVSYFQAITHLLDCAFNKYMYTDHYNPEQDLLRNFSTNLRHVLRQTVNKFLQHYMSQEQWQNKHIHWFNKSHFINGCYSCKELTISNQKRLQEKLNYSTKDYMTLLFYGVRSHVTLRAVADTDEDCDGGILQIYSQIL